MAKEREDIWQASVSLSEWGGHDPRVGAARREQKEQAGAVTLGWSSAYLPPQPGREGRQPSVDSRNAGSGPWPVESRGHTHVPSFLPSSPGQPRLGAVPPHSAPQLPFWICHPLVGLCYRQAEDNFLRTNVFTGVHAAKSSFVLWVRLGD